MTRRLADRFGLLGENFRGAKTITGVGFFIGLAALVAAFAGHGLWDSWFVKDVPSLVAKRAEIASAARPVGLLAFLAALFGLYDDVARDRSAKGFRGHLGALARGKLTSGALKALFAGLAGLAGSVTLFVLGSTGPFPLPERTIWMVVPDALVLALAMNAFNLFDLRPGRVLKVWLPLSAGAWAAAYFGAPPALRLAYLEPPLVAGWLVAAALFPFDLREKLMLGDAGTMAMGALVGWSIIATMGVWVRLLALVMLIALHLATERVSLSDVIERVALLRWSDHLGRPKSDPHA